MAGQKNSRSQSLPTTSNNPAAILLDWLPVAGTSPASAQVLRTNNSKAEDRQTLYRVIVLEDEPHHELFDKNEPSRFVEYNDTSAVRLKRQRNVPQDHYHQTKDGDEFKQQVQAELQEHFRRASYDENPSSTGSDTFRMESMPELRRCRSEVAGQSSFNADGDNNNGNSQVPSATIALLASSSQDTADKSPQPPPLVAQSALTAKDKIQAFARTARELRTLKLHYYPESGWGFVVLFVASLTQCVTYGLLLAAGTLMSQVNRRYGWTLAAAHLHHYQQQQYHPSSTSASASSPQHFLVKPLAPFVTSSSLDPGILAHYRPVYLSSTVSYPTPISSPVAGALAALSLCVASLLSPVIVAWCRRKSTRLTAVFGGLVAALGLLFTSFASQFHQLFLSYGLVLGIGVGLTRDTATLMVGQYFKRRREAVEIALVGSSGIGLAVMTVFLHTTLSAIGWRLGLQAVTGLVLLTFILGSCYRSASLYHPQRRAILHLKNQRKKIKEKNKHEEKPPFFDFSSLKSRTIQTILVSSALIAVGLYTPLIYLSLEAEKSLGRDSSMWLQVYMGLAWTLGCATVGLLIVREPTECRIARQYLCQAAGFLVGLALLSQAVVNTPSWLSYHQGPATPTHQQSQHQFAGGSNYGLFCWIYGFGLGAYHYALKMFVYQRVRARNFARAWSFVQASQAFPLVCGVPLAGFLISEFGQESAYYASSAFVLIGSLALSVIDLRKYVLSRSHSHKHRHQHVKKPRVARPATPAVASEPNTDGGGPGGEGPASSVSAGIGSIGVDRILTQPEEFDEEEDVCPPSCKGRVRRDSLAEEEVHLPPLTLLQQTSLVLAQLGELPCGAAAAELTCISEEGIADMDIPDHLLEELDFAADCITSCDKVENYLMLSEYENNLNIRPAAASERKSRKSSLFKHWGQTFNSASRQHHAGHRSGCPELSRGRELTPTTNPLGSASAAGSGGNAGGTMAAQHGNRRISRMEPPSKMVQIHETSEAEGRV